MNRYKETLREIIKNKSNWSDLKEELSKYNVDDKAAGVKDTSAGQIFEIFTKYYFLTAPEVEGLYDDVWLYDEIPLEIKNELDLGSVEYGVDLLLKTIDDEYIAVQCKFKNDETSKLNWSSDKIANLFAYCPKADGYIVFSNAALLDKVSLTRQEKFTFYSIGHLLEIESSTFKNVELLLNDSQTTQKQYFDPELHQEKSVDECVEWFVEGEESRGQLILPCGAGKTVTALWIKEKLCSKRTLVLVPSLALLRQIKNEWSRQRKTQYRYLCVCSETDIDSDNQDSIITHTYEIGGNVTTNPNKIWQFLTSKSEEKVIFSTYQSLKAIVEAIQNKDFEFDFVFCDEAHKTAGISNRVFGIIHDNDKVPTKNRLYATATPRIVKESIRKKLGDNLKYTHDMNDPETFGEEFYRMTFKEAIDKGILVDYKIIAVGVNDLQISQYLEKRRYVDGNISIDELANNYALEFVMNKYSANHALTFHSRVKYAKEFALRHKNLFNDIDTFSVDGSQPTSIRKSILNEFRNAKKAVISNARCLTEGVDVPTIDLVYFSDPKNSKIDIIQAVGRALRKKEGKELGYVVVPIFHVKDEELDKSISDSSFKNLLQVIRSLCDQDERLQIEINAIAHGKGKRKNSKRIDFVSSFEEDVERLQLIGFEEQLKDALFDQIIDKTSNNWDIWYLELQNYLKCHNDYPTKQKNAELYNWIASQRNKRKKGGLKPLEIKKLDDVNFIWDVIEWKWNKIFEDFVEYAKSNVFPPFKEFDSAELVRWYKYQHTCIRKNKTISQEQKMKFLEIDSKFEGPPSRKKWIPKYEDLVKWRKSNPDRWPSNKKNGISQKEKKLYIFCEEIKKRYREETLEDYWFDKMASLEFNFEGHRDNWTKRLHDIFKVIESNNSVSIYEIGSNNYSWIIRNIKMYREGKLDKYKTKKIEDLNLDRFFNS